MDGLCWGKNLVLAYGAHDLCGLPYPRSMVEHTAKDRPSGRGNSEEGHVCVWGRGVTSWYGRPLG